MRNLICTASVMCLLVVAGVMSRGASDEAPATIEKIIKVDVAGSNPVSRSIFFATPSIPFRNPTQGIREWHKRRRSR